VSLYWLTYRYPDGRSAGVVVVESSALIGARLKAADAKDRWAVYVPLRVGGKIVVPEPGAHP
jgi:hypothetical protein